MNKYMYTDKQLNELNQGPNVYSVNTEFAQRSVKKIEQILLLLNQMTS